MHKNLSTLAGLLLLPMMLAACAKDTQVTSPGTLISSGKPAACLSLSHISPNRGKPGGPSTEDISAALDKAHPIEVVRNLVGDTSQTLTQVDRNNAALATLCGEPNGTPAR
jgi:hypothetical protein